MTEVAFHFNAPDKLAYACRLLRKASGAGAGGGDGEPELLRSLDTALWTFSPLDFVAHCDKRVPPCWKPRPWCWPAPALDAPHQQVLVNLGETVPEGFERFERLIEVVSLDEADRLRARDRWKHYAAAATPSCARIWC
jgi:DNA polymerase-3 subunit chi